MRFRSKVLIWGFIILIYEWVLISWGNNVMGLFFLTIIIMIILLIWGGGKSKKKSSTKKYIKIK